MVPQKEQITKEFTKKKRNYGYQRQRAQCSRQSSIRHIDPDDDELHAGRDPSAGTESRGEFHASVVTP